MTKSNIDLTESEKKFLEIILNRGNVPDSEIAKTTKLSKATVGRIRKKLEGTLVKEYIPIINLHEVGMDVFSILTFQWNAFNDEQITKKSFSEFEKDPRVVFLANGEGSIASTVMFLAFRDLEEHHLYLKEFRKKHGKHASQISTLTLPSKEVIKHDFTEAIRNIIMENKNEK